MIKTHKEWTLHTKQYIFPYLLLPTGRKENYIEHLSKYIRHPAGWQVEFDESMHAGDDKRKNFALAPNVGEILEK